MNYTKDNTTNKTIDIFAQKFCDAYNERGILSIMSHNEDAFFNVLARVEERDFLSPDSKAYFSILCLLNKAGYPKFSKLLITKTAVDLNVEDLCSDAFVDAVLNVPVDETNLPNLITKLLDDSTKYKLFTKLEMHKDTVLTNASSIMSQSSDDLINKVQADLISLSISSEAIAEPKHVSEGLDEYIESIMDTHTPVIGVSTGYPILDKVIDGLIPGTLMIVAARKKMGKSTVLTNIAAHVAIHDGLPTLYVDTEMTFKEWRDRVLAIISGVQERTIKHGGFSKDRDVLNRLQEAAKYLKKSKLFHHYLPGYNLEKITALYKKYKFKEDIQLGVFDYIKEPESASIEAGRKEYQILGDVTTRLKDLSGQLNIPFLAAVQVNRSGDVADSDRVARYGDIVAFWGLRDLKKAEEEAVDLDVAGHYGLCIRDTRRGGTTGEWGIGFKFKKTKLRIIEVSQENQVETFDYLNDLKLDVGSSSGGEIFANHDTLL